MRSLITGVLAGVLALPAAGQDLVLAGGNVIDVRTGIARVASVLVRDGVIEAVSPALSPPPDATVIDATGRWVIPGLIETHSHATGSGTLRRALALGITSALTIHTGPDADRPDIEGPSQLPDIPSPRVYLVGGRFSGEFPGALVPSAPRFPTPATPEAARTMLDSLRASGVRRIKIWMDDGTAWMDMDPMPVFDDAVFGSLVRGAHARGMAVYVHAWTADQYRRALRARPTWIIHPMMDAELTADDVGLMRRADLGWTTTLAQALGLGDPPRFARRLVADARLTAAMSADTREYFAELARESTNPAVEQYPILAERLASYMATIGRNSRFLALRGIPLTVGSDRTVGVGTHMEIELMREAGLDTRTVLRAAILGGAQALGVDDGFGTVEVGKVADLLVIPADPLAEITNLRDVEIVIKGGHLWRPAELLSPDRTER